MTAHDDPGSELRGALDREVARRFDAKTTAARVGERRAEERIALLREGHVRARGPLARVPATVQWIGVVAAVIAAITGLRSLVLDLNAQRPAPQAETRPAPQEILPLEKAVEPQPVVQAKKVEPAVPPKVATESPRSTPEAEPEPAAPADASTLEARNEATRPEKPRAAGGTIASVTTVPVAEPTPVRKEDAPPAAGPGPAAAPVGEIGGLQETAIGGVRIATRDLARHGLAASIREVPEIGATLVTLRGPGVEPERQTLAAFGAVPPQEGGEAAGGRSPRGIEIVEEPAPLEGDATYARLFVGAALDHLAEGERGFMGKGVRIVPLADAEVWGGGDAEGFLKNEFLLRSLVAGDGAWIPVSSESSGSTGSLLAGVGGNFYDVTLRVAPGTEGTQRIELKLARRFPQGTSERQARAIDATLEVENGRVVVIGVQDALLMGRGASALGPPGTTTTFLVLSPRLGELAPQEPLPRVVRRDRREAPILIEGGEPLYPAAARRLGVQGRVLLRAVVRDDGSVERVQVLEVPDVPGAEYLIEAVSSALREWRYLPARRNGQAIPAYVTVAVEFQAQR